MIEVVTIDTPSLGDRTYLATEHAAAGVVDQVDLAGAEQALADG